MKVTLTIERETFSVEELLKIDKTQRHLEQIFDAKSVTRHVDTREPKQC